MDFLTILPNLSIGVVAVISLVWYAHKSQTTMRDMHKCHVKEITGMHEVHMTELKEREAQIRKVEHEVRTSITGQLNENTKLMERVVHKLDK